MTENPFNGRNVFHKLYDWIRREFFETRSGIHVWRWRALTIWIVAFSILTFAALREGRANDRAIQGSRVFSVKHQCFEQNQRHDESIKTLDKVLAQYVAAHAKTKAAKAALRKSLKTNRAENVLLINALVPKRDCEKVANFLTDVELKP